MVGISGPHKCKAKRCLGEQMEVCCTGVLYGCAVRVCCTGVLYGCAVWLSGMGPRELIGMIAQTLCLHPSPHPSPHPFPHLAFPRWHSCGPFILATLHHALFIHHPSFTTPHSPPFIRHHSFATPHCLPLIGAAACPLRRTEPHTLRGAEDPHSGCGVRGVRRGQWRLSRPLSKLSLTTQSKQSGGGA